MIETNIIDMPISSQVIDADYEVIAFRRRNENGPFAARVNIHKYRDDVRRYENAVRILNGIRKGTEFIMVMDIIFIMFVSSGIDVEEQFPIILKLLGAGMVIALLCALILRIPTPKLPKGVALVNGRYVIVKNVYPGRNPIIIGRDCVFKDRREASVVPYEIDEDYD